MRIGYISGLNLQEKVAAGLTLPRLMSSGPSHSAAESWSKSVGGEGRMMSLIYYQEAE